MIILAEKPSVAAAFASALGVPKKNGFYENDSYCIVNALGHLLENYMPEDYDPKLEKWNLADLPIIPEKTLFKVCTKTKAQLDLIKKCFASLKDDELLLATDAEREGELIGAEILEYVGFKKYNSAKRFWVSEALTKDVVLEGIKNAKPLPEYASYKEQGYARQTADWLVGMNLSRFVTLSCNKLFTVGRVQTAILNAIFQREELITNFTKEKYFELAATLSGEENDFTLKLLNKNNSEFPFRFNQTDSRLKEVLEKIKNTAGAKITSAKKEKKISPPPQLFNITGLQKEANKKFSYAPEQTLNIAQSLYEKHKCLSYPRTPSRVMGDENIDLVKSIFTKIETAYPEKIYNVNTKLISKENKRIFNSGQLQDHHALIPLAPIPDAASAEEKNIYNLVLEQFITLLKPDYIYFTVKVEAEIDGEVFAGSGIEVLQSGWKTGKRDEEKEEEKEENFYNINEGECYQIKSFAINEKLTEPKKRYTFASILSLMENPRGEEGKHLIGLGTPATRGNILETLIKRKYIELKAKNLVITEDGKFLINVIQKSNILKNFTSIQETTKWEEQLHENTEKFLESIKDFVRNAVKIKIEQRYENPQKIAVGKCPLCGKEIREGKTNYYCTGYKDDPKCNFVIWKTTAGAGVSTADVLLLLDGKKTKVKKCKSKAGKEFSCMFVLKNGKIEFEFEDTGGKKK